MPIHSFQSRDRLEDLEGKTSYNCSTSVSIFHLFPRLFIYYFFSKGISEQNASFGHLQSILSTRGNISIINSVTKHCKNT